MVTDIAKAFDTIHLKFLLRILEVYKMPKQWRDIVATINDDTEGRLWLQPNGPLIPMHGVLKQGCPVSGPGCILYVQFINDLIEYALQKSGVPPLISRHDFVDDMLPVSTSLDTLHVCGQQLVRVGNATNFCINVQKSGILSTQAFTWQERVEVDCYDDILGGLPLLPQAKMLGVLVGRTVTM